MPACLPFDKRRRRFRHRRGRRGILVLEEYEHAEARGAKIYGEVVGYGATCDAYPHHRPPAGRHRRRQGHGQLALEEAGWQPEETVDYINAHGTGTPLNDAGWRPRRSRLAFGEQACQLCLISSTKSMTGHMLGAAGAVEAVVCAEGPGGGHPAPHHPPGRSPTPPVT